MKTKQFVATGIMALFLVAGTSSAFAGSSGAVGQGNISVYQGGKLVDKFSGKNPVQDETLLACEGQCIIKATGISLIGADGVRLAIKSDQERFNLLVNEGRVEFVVTDSINKMAFYTPAGQYTVADIMFSASTNTPVRGYMQVADNGAAEVGVYEGRMVFSTADGAKTIDSNNRIQLAQIGAGAAGAGAAGAGAGAAGAGVAAAGAGAAVGAGAAAGLAGIGVGTLVAGGVIATGAVVAVVAVADAATDDDDPSSSPSY